MELDTKKIDDAILAGRAGVLALALSGLTTGGVGRSGCAGLAAGHGSLHNRGKGDG